MELTRKERRLLMAAAVVLYRRLNGCSLAVAYDAVRTPHARRDFRTTEALEVFVRRQSDAIEARVVMLLERQSNQVTAARLDDERDPCDLEEDSPATINGREVRVTRTLGYSRTSESLRNTGRERFLQRTNATASPSSRLSEGEYDYWIARADIRHEGEVSASEGIAEEKSSTIPSDNPTIESELDTAVSTTAISAPPMVEGSPVQRPSSSAVVYAKGAVRR